MSHNVRFCILISSGKSILKDNKESKEWTDIHDQEGRVPKPVEFTKKPAQEVNLRLLLVLMFKKSTYGCY